MAFCAFGVCAVPRRVLSAAVFTTLVLLLAVAAAEEQAETSAKSSPVTLRTIIAGTCHEIQLHIESLVGTNVVRSVVEVKTGNRFVQFPIDIYVVLLLSYS